ncbi:hypothetical protein J2X31_000241 [Flavobacterium arsenatis]|uniref:PLD phosphodiesterase domain-containing protein n=1 Tax=Flavobacterium arsenatis TaxID=1484332 RepID=A0ABU1TLG1_9FLAO|nr:phospholipase D-like domain-containing protein [Flavobacterium arsenatis]MDR6966248.1 hypothetical protein [Flavobacterium arsenatis]
MNEEILKNPITERVQISINKSKNKLNFAVPFLNSFALSLFSETNLKQVTEKRLITRFDETCLIAFELPTLKKLLDLGFKIRFDNDIHLKLYITDSETFVTSSNLTRGGFENNIELTIKVDSENSEECNGIFNQLWQTIEKNEVTDELINENWSKYELLKKRNEFASKTKKDITIKTNIGDIDIQSLIKEIFNRKEDYSKTRDLVFKANQVKKDVKVKLINGFNKQTFYVFEGLPNRKDNLFYDFTYGYEANIASTGLREAQFRDAFESAEFRNAINYIFPEMIGSKPWNFEDKEELFEFCNGLFEFRIPQYTEALPIRLASYFYPEYFVPIFKLDHLQKICEALEIDTNAKAKGERFFAYTTFIAERMSLLPYDNYIKSHIGYDILYTVELYKRLANGETYGEILSSYKQNWKKNYIMKGKDILEKIIPTSENISRV